MGGHAEGARASYTAVDLFCRAAEAKRAGRTTDFLADLADEADAVVSGLSDSADPLKRAGSTLAAVYLENGAMNWISAGDSRIYIWRGGGFARITQDHTYELILQNAFDNGEISRHGKTASQ